MRWMKIILAMANEDNFHYCPWLLYSDATKNKRVMRKNEWRELSGRMEGCESNWKGEWVQKEWKLKEGSNGLTPEPKELASVEDYS